MGGIVWEWLAGWPVVGVVPPEPRVPLFRQRPAHPDPCRPARAKRDHRAASTRGRSGALWSGTNLDAPFVTVELAMACQSGAKRRGDGAPRSLVADRQCTRSRACRTGQHLRRRADPERRLPLTPIRALSLCFQDRRGRPRGKPALLPDKPQGLSFGLPGDWSSATRDSTVAKAAEFRAGPKCRPSGRMTC